MNSGGEAARRTLRELLADAHDRRRRASLEVQACVSEHLRRLVRVPLSEGGITPEHSVRLLVARAAMLEQIAQWERDGIEHVDWVDAGSGQCSKCRTRHGRRMTIAQARRVLRTEFCIAGRTKAIDDPLQGCRCTLMPFVLPT